MTASRTWNLRLNLDEFNALAASLYTDADRALVLQGLSLGINGGDLPQGAPASFLKGWEMGHGMRSEAERFRDVQSERGRSSAEKRRERNGSAQPIKPGQSRTEPEPPFEPVFEPPLEPPVEPNHNPQSTILKTTNDKPIPPTPQRGNRAGRATAPTEDEWVAYCTKTWPDWHPTCAAESWAYYQAKGWRIGSVPVRDWQAAARTSHGNARQWGKLQPVPVADRAGNQPQNANVRQSMPPWKAKTLEDLGKRLQKAEATLRRSRLAAFGKIGWEEGRSNREEIEAVEAIQAEISRLRA